MPDRVTAFAPGSVGNVAVGFDVLGHAFSAVGDRVTVHRTNELGARITQVEGVVKDLPTDAAKNTAGVAVSRMLSDLALDFGVVLSIEKGIPLSSGLGGSAASAVAAVVAVNALIDEPLTNQQLLRYALVGEAASAGGDAHVDNVASSLLGGLVYARNGTSPQLRRIPVPESIRCVVVRPHCEIKTRDARAALGSAVPLHDFVAQSANLAGFIIGCYENDLDLIAATLSDVLIEPQRAHLIPGFSQVKRAALDHGALGCSISGSGPSVFAWCAEDTVRPVGEAMVAAFAASAHEADLWVSGVDPAGAHVVED